MKVLIEKNFRVAKNLEFEKKNLNFEQKSLINLEKRVILNNFNMSSSKISI